MAFPDQVIADDPANGVSNPQQRLVFGTPIVSEGRSASAPKVVKQHAAVALVDRCLAGLDDQVGYPAARELWQVLS